MYLCSSQDKDKADCTSLISCICSSVSPVWTLRLSNTLLCQELTRRKQQITCVPNREIRLHWSNSSVKVMNYAPYSGVIWTGAEWVKGELCLMRRGSRHVNKRRQLQGASSWWSDNICLGRKPPADCGYPSHYGTYHWGALKRFQHAGVCNSILAESC